MSTLRVDELLQCSDKCRYSTSAVENCNCPCGGKLHNIPLQAKRFNDRIKDKDMEIHLKYGLDEELPPWKFPGVCAKCENIDFITFMCAGCGLTFCGYHAFDTAGYCPSCVMLPYPSGAFRNINEPFNDWVRVDKDQYVLVVRK